MVSAQYNSIKNCSEIHRKCGGKIDNVTYISPRHEVGLHQRGFFLVESENGSDAEDPMTKQRTEQSPILGQGYFSLDARFLLFIAERVTDGCYRITLTRLCWEIYFISQGSIRPAESVKCAHQQGVKRHSQFWSYCRLFRSVSIPASLVLFSLI